MLYALLTGVACVVLVAMSIKPTHAFIAGNKDCDALEECFACARETQPVKCRVLARFNGSDWCVLVDNSMESKVMSQTDSLCSFYYESTFKFVCETTADAARSNIVWLFVSIVVTIAALTAAIFALKQVSVCCFLAYTRLI